MDAVSQAPYRFGVRGITANKMMYFDNCCDIVVREGSKDVGVLLLCCLIMALVYFCMCVADLCFRLPFGDRIVSIPTVQKYGLYGTHRVQDFVCVDKLAYCRLSVCRASLLMRIVVSQLFLNLDVFPN